jgi:carboxymethylenebutenolidase
MRTLTYVILSLSAGLASAQNAAIPPNQETAAAALKASTRHQEFVRLKLPSGGEVNTFVVFPERPDKAPVIIVIHEIFGATEWVNSVADQFAAQGFIALAPDMVTGIEGNPTATVRALTKDQIVERLNVVRDYALKIPAATGKIGSVGFCWGGSASWVYATAQPALDAAVVYYGTAPSNEELAGVKAPILGLFGENDARVDVTVEPAKKELDRLGRSFEYKMLAGAGHGFLRAQTATEANLQAAKTAWPMTIDFFRKHLEAAK